MLNIFFKVLIQVFTIAALSPTSHSHAGSGRGQETHGGDPIVAQFKDAAFLSVFALRNGLQDRFPQIPADQLERFIQNVQVESTSRPLYLTAGSENPIPFRNHAPRPLIEINSTSWLSVSRDQETRIRMAIHEYLYFLEVPDTGYVLSGRFASEYTQWDLLRLQEHATRPAIMETRAFRVESISTGVETGESNLTGDGLAASTFIRIEVRGRSLTRTSVYTLSGSAALDEGGTGSPVPRLTFSLRPFEHHRTLFRDPGLAREFIGTAPVTITRNTALGEELTIRIHAFTYGLMGGVAEGINNPVGVRRPTGFFIQAVIDILGLGYMLPTTSSSGRFGLEFASATFQAGFAANLSDNVGLQFTLIGLRGSRGLYPHDVRVLRPTLTEAPASNDDQTSMQDAELYSRLEARIGRNLRLFLQPGLRQRRYDLLTGNNSSNCESCAANTQYYLNGGAVFRF